MVFKMNEYEGKWMETYTGKKFHILEPTEDEIDIRDIAHSLSMQCRYNGHVRQFYSVAEHSYRLSYMVEDSLAALLHDAAETYLGDMIRTVKICLPEFKVLEAKIQTLIFHKFGVKSYDKKAIKKADNILLATEVRDLMNNTKDWHLPEAPLEERIIPDNYPKGEFLVRFGQLYRR